MEAQIDRRGRLVTATGTLYVFVLLAVVAYGSAEFRQLYTMRTPAPGEYHQFLRLSGLGLALYLGIWTAAFGLWRRSYWQGAIALAAGAAMTILALSLLPWVFFPFDQYSASATWVFGNGVLTPIIWALVTISGRMLLRRDAASAAT